MIDRPTGALVLPGGTAGRELTRSTLLPSPMGASATCDDMRTCWMHVHLGPQALAGGTFGVTLQFEGERLDGYALCLVDERYATMSWDDYSEDKQLALRDAHDAWLVAALGPGEREPSPRGPELHYAFAWGKVWSTFDARGGSCSIGARFRREASQLAPRGP